MVASLVLSACVVQTPAEPAAPAETKFSVGVVLPTKDEPRWIQDETRFRDAFQKAGYDVQILFSQGDSAKEKANVESLINQGVKVIIICPMTPLPPPPRPPKPAPRGSRWSLTTVIRDTTRSTTM